MKFFLILAAVGSLVSCNTSIGLWRDTKAGFNWTKGKIQESGNNSEELDTEYGAPVY